MGLPKPMRLAIKLPCPNDIQIKTVKSLSKNEFRNILAPKSQINV
jgi:hypothetical protein